MNPFIKFFKNPSFGFYTLVFGAIILFLPACNQDKTGEAPSPPLPQTPREAYLSALDSNGLAGTQMAKTWQLAGMKALEDSVHTAPPFREIGYFRADVPAASAYRINLKTGELLEIDLVSEPAGLLFFVDLFLVEPTDSSSNLRHVFSAENYRTDSLTYEVEEAATYLLRIQPELLASCRYTLQLIVQPVYGVFPVEGKNNPDVWSRFGDPRDGGRREHKGIDIFARRGTPVLASVEGRIRSVRDRGRGGKQVWLYDPQRYQSLYYAHLDSQLVKEGQWVLAGDTLGWVGNTGNARNTRPHLHFSIYRSGYGPIDPYPFVAYQAAEAPAIYVDTARLGQLARTRQPNTRLLAAPEPRSAVLATLDRHLPLEIIAASKAWYRVRLPDGLSGYLPASNLQDGGLAINKTTLAKATELLESPHPEAAPVSGLQRAAEVEIMGVNGGYQLVRDREGLMGWMAVPAR